MPNSDRDIYIADTLRWRRWIPPQEITLLGLQCISNSNVNLCDKLVPGTAKLIHQEAHGEELKWSLIFTELVPRRSSRFSWYNTCTLNITKINASVVAHEWFLLLVPVQSCMLWVGLPGGAFVPPWLFFSSRTWSNLQTWAIAPLLSLFLSRTANIKVWKGRCWEMCLSWLVWEGIPWVGALGCWASGWERNFPECSPKLLISGKLMMYLTKSFLSLQKLRKKIIFFYLPFLIPWELQFGQMFQCKFWLLPLHPQINPLHFPSVSVAVWATKLGNEALILKSLLNL